MYSFNLLKLIFLTSDIWLELADDDKHLISSKNILYDE